MKLKSLIQGRFFLVLLAGAVFFPLTASAELVVPLHRSEMVVLPEAMSTVLVADPDIADVVEHGTTRISVIGKRIGATTIRVLKKNNEVIREIPITVSYDLPAIRKSLASFFPYERIGVERVHGTIALTGTVSNAAIADKALKIASQFIDDTGSGQTSSASSSAAAAGPQMSPSEAKIINLLQITSGQQVMLRVRVGEIQRSTMRNLGLSVNATKTGNNDFSFVSGFLPAASGGANAPFTFTGGVTRGDFDLSATLSALEQNGLFKVLAEPNLVAISGEKAEFLAGGEFPIPIAQPGGSGATTITVEFKTFGVGVEFTPYVLSENRLRLAVQPEVSELSDEGAVTIDDFRIPGISTRRARTTVELAPGETFMIAGLLKDNMRTTVSQIPGIAEIPIFSSLFRSTAFQHNETELVMAVTPYVVDPVSGGDIKLPTDNYRPASMMETVFYGALGALSGDAYRVSQTPSLEGPVGFMTE